MKKSNDEFVYSVPIHTIFRFMGLVAGIIILYKGLMYKDPILKAVGSLTILIDTITFVRALYFLKK
jgi:hypothetical protein